MSDKKHIISNIASLILTKEKISLSALVNGNFFSQVIFFYKIFFFNIDQRFKFLGFPEKLFLPQFQNERNSLKQRLEKIELLCFDQKNVLIPKFFRQLKNEKILNQENKLFFPLNFSRIKALVGNCFIFIYKCKKIYFLDSNFRLKKNPTIFMCFHRPKKM